MGIGPVIPPFPLRMSSEEESSEDITLGTADTSQPGDEEPDVENFSDSEAEHSFQGIAFDYGGSSDEF